MARKSRAAYQKAWRDKNKVAVLDYHRAYRDEHRENRRKWNRDWIRNNRERYNASKYAYRDRIKVQALLRYSNGTMRCARCGFGNQDALCLDHIDDNGAEHRKELKISCRGSEGAGTNTYEALKREGWPDGLQVLCANCNLIKEMERRRGVRMTNKYYASNTST